MPKPRQSVDETIREIISWRPVFEPVLSAFAPILTEQEALSREFAGQTLSALPLRLPELSASRAQSGVSLLAEEAFTGVSAQLRFCAQKLLPLLEGIPALADDLPALRDFFLREELREEEADSRDTLAKALVRGDRQTMARIAEEHGVDPSVLEFACTLLLSPVLRGMVLQTLVEKDAAPWDEAGVWQQGYCPVCGALPAIGWLKKAVFDEKNAYLAGGGGKKQLHCGLCGADWSVKRGLCPSCAAEGNGVMEILRDSESAHAERLEWCTKCKGYLPVVDLREREKMPDPEAAALGMMHLDMVAAQKDLRPLRPSFWNTF